MQQQIVPPGGSHCFHGLVIIVPTGLIGATTGVLAVQNTTIPIRQVPGPDVRGVPLSQLHGQNAVVCGQFVQDSSGITLNVSFATPLLDA